MIKHTYHDHFWPLAQKWGTICYTDKCLPRSGAYVPIDAEIIYFDDIVWC